MRESAMKETKLQMFTDISHEIRTPLNLVMAPLRKLLDKEEDADKKESYEMMYRNASQILEHMNRLEESRLAEAEEIPEYKVPEVTGPAEEMEEKALKSKKNLILVDDNAEMRRYLKMELRNQFNIETCASAEEAWKRIVGTIPDAVVTDFITGGEMDGADLCGKIKHNPSTNLVPVLILSSQWDEETLRKCTENGADRYLVKPVPVDLLRTSIQQAISTREAIRNKYTSDMSYDYEEITIPSAEKMFLPKVVETIKAHISDPDFGVEELSREIGMSRVHMNRKLKESINISPSSFIKSIKLKQGAYLLVNNKVNISEVAYRVGYDRTRSAPHRRAISARTLLSVTAGRPLCT
jgi:CheY-like chemotaxis protein